MNDEKTKIKVLLVTSARADNWLKLTSQPAVAGLLGLQTMIENSDDDVELYITTLHELDFSVSNQKLSIYDNWNKMDLSEYDVVHLRGVYRSLVYYADYAPAIAHYVRFNHGVLIEDNDIGTEHGKLGQAMLFAVNDIPVPNTWSSWSGQRLMQLVERAQLAYPLIVKASGGTKGDDNFLVQSKDALAEVLAQTQTQYVVQELIPNNGDYRVLFLGKDSEPLVLRRNKIEGSHLSNTSKGSAAEWVENDFDERAMKIARDAHKVSGRYCSGVDIMQNEETGEWVILEVNLNAAIGTGAFLEPKAAKYIEMIKTVTKVEKV